MIRYLENNIKDNIKVNFGSLNVNKPTNTKILKKINKLLVRSNPENLQHLSEKEQTKDICLIAVRKNGNTLRFVKKQTSEICDAAIKNKKTAAKYKTQYINNKTNNRI